MKSEIYKHFNPDRADLESYGFTCETWLPEIMPRFDRHNEIEINYLPHGSITYQQQDREIMVPGRRFTLFWGIIPHRIVHYENVEKYYVCTIPLDAFLRWNLSGDFVDALLRGDILYAQDDSLSSYDEELFALWSCDSTVSQQELVMLELQCRVMRMSFSFQDVEKQSFLAHNEASVLDQLVIFIFKNYCNPIKMRDVGKSVGLHPDYANKLFRQTFHCTISDYITELRIAHAQRLLLTTDYTMAEIAYFSGFNSPARFNVAFLKITGFTPKEYKKIHIAKKNQV